MAELKNGDEIRNPKWIRPSMTIEQAASAASQRGFYLKAHFDPTMGLRIIAVRRDVQG